MAITISYGQFMILHVEPGFLFFIWGVWHLLNNIKIHLFSPKSYVSLPWFSFTRKRYIELYLVIGCSIIHVALFMKAAVFVLPASGRSQILPSVEHLIMFLTFSVYGVFAIVLDKLNPPTAYDLTSLIYALGFGQELLVFHFHSTDHVGVEGQYHWFVQITISITFATSLLAIKYPRSFLIGFVRSISVVFQGFWLMLMGIMMWTPHLIPKGCYLNNEGGHWTVRCHENEALHRAKSLVNIQFSLCVIGVIAFAIALYLIMIKIHFEKIAEYQMLRKSEEIKDERQ